MSKPPPKKKPFRKKPQPPGLVSAVTMSPSRFGNNNAVNLPISLLDTCKIVTSAFPGPYKKTIDIEIQSQIRNNLDQSPPFAIPVASHYWTVVSALVPAYRKAREMFGPFMKKDISISTVGPDSLVNEMHDAYIMEVTLNRCKRKPRVRLTDQFTETVYKIVTPAAYVSDDQDYRFRALILYTPLSATFATMSHRVNSRFCDEDNPDPILLPSSWLRIRKNEGSVALGGYVRHVHHIWAMDWTSQCPNLFKCYHMNDDEEGMPVLPPDFINGVSQPDKKLAAEAFNEGVANSRTFGFGCRHYVAGFLHKDIPSSCLVLNHRAIGDFVLQVAARNRHGKSESMSFIKVTSTVGYDFLTQSLQRSNDEYAKLSRTASGNSRHDKGDFGHMLGVGFWTNHQESTMIECAIARTHPNFVNCLDDVSKAAAKFGLDKFPGVVTTIRSLEESLGVCPPAYLGGEEGISSCMALTKNLMNATHYDVNDGSVCFAIWQELIPSMASGWRFVLPNVVIRYNDETYNGVAINLSHGTSICWDGRQIRHGTTIHDIGSEDNRTMGYWYGASSKTIKFHASA